MKTRYKDAPFYFKMKRLTPEELKQWESVNNLKADLRFQCREKGLNNIKLTLDFVKERKLTLRDLSHEMTLSIIDTFIKAKVKNLKKKKNG